MGLGHTPRMLDRITLDQLRMLLAVADEGSFSAAARKLTRVQSAVSHAMANLESQLAVTLWDRSTKIPTLTDQGRIVLTAARRVCDDADALARLADGLSAGLEATLSLCVDAVFPVTALVDLCREFGEKYPAVELRVHTETLGAVAARVLDGTCQIGVMGPAAHARGLERMNLTRIHLTKVRMIPVVARRHPLAGVRGRVSSERLSREVQIVLSERGDTRSPDQAVLGTRTFRVVDLYTKRELLLAGLGWGNLPEHTARADLRAKRLVRLRPAAWPDEGHVLALSVIHEPGLVMGPATVWLLERMKTLCKRDTAPLRAKV